MEDRIQEHMSEMGASRERSWKKKIVWVGRGGGKTCRAVWQGTVQSYSMVWYEFEDGESTV